MDERTIARFWSKVDKNGRPNLTLGCCWEWTASRLPKGYGRFPRPDGYTAHRFSWLLHAGQPPEGMHVLHRCDNPPCVNPAHLFLGTNFDNVRDMDEKGRRRWGYMSGSKNGNSRLVESSVPLIRRLYASGVSPRDIAAIFDVSEPTAYRVGARRSWRHVE